MYYQSFTVNTYMLLKANSDKSEGAVIYSSWRSLILGGNSYVLVYCMDLLRDHLVDSTFPLIRYILFMDPGNFLLPNTFFTYIQGSTLIEVIWVSYVNNVLPFCIFHDSVVCELCTYTHPFLC